MNTNPLVKSSIGLTIMDITALSNVLFALLGLRYGYLIQKLEDVGVTSWIFTLCSDTKKKRRLRNVDISLVKIAIEAWSLGRGLSKLDVKWEY